MRRRSKGIFLRLAILILALPFILLGLSFGHIALGQQEVSWKALKTQIETLFHQGKIREATSLAKEAVKVAEQTFGSGHHNVATSLSNLAMLYQAQGQYAEAEPLHKQALVIREKVLGPDHPDVALSLNNLATLYKKQGRYAKAEPLYKRALVIWEKALGPDHHFVVQILNNLAGLYQAQGQHAKAEPLNKRVLAIREKASRPDHPHLAQGVTSKEESAEFTIPLNSGDPLFKKYLVAVHNRILHVWRYPDDAEPGLRGKVDILFSIEGDGSLSQAKVIKSSGYPVLDIGAKEAMRGATPFLPLPLEFNINRLNIVGNFEYN